MATIEKKRGNPNFVKRTAEPDIAGINNAPNLHKEYIFQLIRTHEKQKPISAKMGDLGGEILSPYQPFFAVVNSGLAWDATYVPREGAKPGASRRWRYLHGFPTIWVDEQIDPEPTKEEIASNLNDIVFRNGILRVFEHEQTKLQAVMLNDAFEGCKRPLKNVPHQYRLLDQDKIDKEVLSQLDEQFEAEKAAREATPQEMYALAYFFGIDLAQTDEAIRKHFITKARSNPIIFKREFVNPKNKYKYIFMTALGQNIISDTRVPGHVYLVEADRPVYDLRTDSTIEELSAAVMGNDQKATDLYNQLRKMIED